MMSVYVDAIHENWQLLGTLHLSCHLLADSDQELEAFAQRLQLNKSWKHSDHYDLTPHKRWQAVKLGAIEVNSRFLAQLRKRRREIEDAQFRQQHRR